MDSVVFEEFIRTDKFPSSCQRREGKSSLNFTSGAKNLSSSTPSSDLLYWKSVVEKDPPMDIRSPDRVMDRANNRPTDLQKNRVLRSVRPCSPFYWGGRSRTPGSVITNHSSRDFNLCKPIFRVDIRGMTILWNPLIDGFGVKGVDALPLSPGETFPNLFQRSPTTCHTGRVSSETIHRRIERGREPSSYW